VFPACLANMELTLVGRCLGLWTVIVSVSSSVLDPMLVPRSPLASGCWPRQEGRLSPVQCTPYPRIALAHRLRRGAVHTLSSGARPLSLICSLDGGFFQGVTSVSRGLCWAFHGLDMKCAVGNERPKINI